MGKLFTHHSPSVRYPNLGALPTNQLNQSIPNQNSSQGARTRVMKWNNTSGDGRRRLRLLFITERNVAMQTCRICTSLQEQVSK